MMNFNDYQNAINEMTELRKSISAPMLLHKEPMPTELTARMNAAQQQIHDFEQAHPFAVRQKLDYPMQNGLYRGGSYVILGMYSTLDEAINNCPAEDAHVYNIVTYETLYTSPIQGE